jgi:epoxyqueuosine reductase
MDDQKKETVSRRDFLSGTALTTAAAAVMVAGAAAPGLAEAAVGPTHERTKKSWAVKASVRKRTVDPHPVTGEYKRYDQKMNMIFRPAWDDSQKFINQKNAETSKELAAKNTPGYGPYDQALSTASGAVATNLGTQINAPDVGLNSWKPLKPGAQPPKMEIKDLAEHTRKIKKSAIFLGASDVGIAKLDMRWVYSHHFVGGKSVPMNLPEGVQYAVVMAMEMDRDAIATAPTRVCEAETMMSYSKMAALVASVAEMIRAMGYTAVPTMNDTALNVPLAIDAGLGEQGRMGIVVHPKFGPRMRICKVLTDMPLQPDQPIEFGVQEFCEACKKCATKCPAQCIGMGSKSDKAPTASENPGIVKWQVDHEKCRANGWAATGTNCTICISVCPYNKGEGWIHDATKLALAKAPFVGGAVARMDDLMEFGEQADPNEWWKKD